MRTLAWDWASEEEPTNMVVLGIVLFIFLPNNGQLTNDGPSVAAELPSGIAGPPLDAAPGWARFG
jgi:hypothetical protein